MDSLARGVAAAGGMCVGAGPQKDARALNYLFEPIGHHMTTNPNYSQMIYLYIIYV